MIWKESCAFHKKMSESKKLKTGHVSKSTYMVEGFFFFLKKKKERKLYCGGPKGRWLKVLSIMFSASQMHRALKIEF